MSNTDYLPTGSGGTGSHPTIAGNVLDPNIQSDARMSGGPGVGGTSEQHVREEGAEHIRQNPDTTSSSVQEGSGLGSSGGLSSFGEGGVSGSSYEGDRSIGSETGQTTSGSSGGVLASTMSYLGLGGASSTSGTGSTAVGDSSSYEPQGETSNTGYSSREAQSALGGAGVYGGSAALGSERETSSYGETGDRSYGGQSTGGLGSDNQSYGGESTGGLGSTGSAGNDLASQEAAATRTPTDSNVNTGSDPVDSAAPIDTETADAPKGDKAYEEKLHDKHASTRENTDAIPTAGGEKLGARHWGESKIVPENPKPEGGDSDEFSKTVRDNTNRNTGPASEPTGTGAIQKESMMDKVKDKLHLGSSLGSADAH